ncbi:dienelactone hydrolase family protein [Dongia sp.]|uniref:dienelactone hydrolase family protein n=1 Tax=Dongia sp. TaxID=1977262 RepID=UPI003750C335
MRTETVTYEADGLHFKSELFVEAGTEPKPGVLVFPEAFGLGDHARHRAEGLAKLGYAALACDIHGNGRLVQDLGEALGLLKPLYADTRRMRARGLAALKLLKGREEVAKERTASIGFCFGGTMSLELARSGADLMAVVGFHSGLSTTAPKSDAKAYRGRVLVCIGADDPFIKPEERNAFEDEMRNAGVDWQMHLYGGVVHSFTNVEADKRNNPAMRYSEAADKASWASMQELFTATLIA